MELITVEVICPAAARNYDFRLSPNMKGRDAKKRIIDDIRSYENDEELFEEADILFFSKDTILDEKLTLSEMGIKSGDRLMIV